MLSTEMEVVHHPGADAVTAFCGAASSRVIGRAAAHSSMCEVRKRGVNVGPRRTSHGVSGSGALTNARRVLVLSGERDAGDGHDGEVTGVATASEKGVRARQIALIAVWGVASAHVASFVAAHSAYNDVGLLTTLLSNYVSDPGVLNGLYWAIFTSLGVWPLIYAMMLYPGSPRQRTWFNVSTGVSFFLGMFALGPYLALRGSPSENVPPPKESWRRRALESRAAGLYVLAQAVAAYVVASGIGAFPMDLVDVVLYARWVDLVRLFNASPLVHGSCIDCVLMWAFLPAAVVDDMKRRGLWGSDAVSNWLIVATMQAVPLLGPAVYLLTRPALPLPSEQR
mmetsp:Transcript_12197/g.32833  ORF Transcript_12197/g.32833 Transcript_12197/m.32833 type:complete len:339 (+) Transcript_12197:44-1060(+)